MSHRDFSSYPIMLVDDEPDVLSLLKSFLRHEGFQKVVTFEQPHAKIQDQGHRLTSGSIGSIGRRQYR